MSVAAQVPAGPVVVGPPLRLLRDPAAPTGPAVRLGLEALVSLLDDAGLTGRGGAGFPTGRKLAAVATQERRPALVVNAMEGEPLARKDQALITLAPDSVLDGAEIFGHALGARRIVIGVGSQIPTYALRAAVARRRSFIELRVLPDRFLGGQESALVNALDGRSPVPTDPTTPVWQRGLAGRPTMLVNTETAAQVALVARHGAAWFRSAGTPDDPGTCLLSVSGTSHRVIASGVTEVERGTPLGDVLARFGVRDDHVGGVLVGGYHGAWLPPSALGTPLDRASLAPWGAALGAGVIQVLDSGHCPLALTAGIVTYLARQSARQCGPCVNGLPLLARAVTDLSVTASGERSSWTGGRGHPGGDIARLAGLVEGRGACAHPDGTARLVSSTMRIFADHVEAHAQGRCPR